MAGTCGGSIAGGQLPSARWVDWFAVMVRVRALASSALRDTGGGAAARLAMGENANQVVTVYIKTTTNPLRVLVSPWSVAVAVGYLTANRAPWGHYSRQVMGLHSVQARTKKPATVNRDGLVMWSGWLPHTMPQPRHHVAADVAHDDRPDA